MPSSASTTTTADIDDDFEPLADETAAKARRVVASYAADADELRTLLDMLGIGPEPEDD